VAYRVYYADRPPVDGDGPSTDLEPRGVQAIVQDHPEVGVEISTGSDYYVWRGGRWVGVDKFGLYDYLLESGLVLFGRTVTSGEYRRIFKEAVSRKETWLQSERRP